MRKPRSERWSSKKVRNSRPPPIASTKATATWPATRACRSRCDVEPETPRRKPCSRSGFDAWKAGMSPKISTATREVPKVNARTRKSSWTSPMRGRLAGAKASRISSSAPASAKPRPPAATAMTRLSASSCEMMRRRPAPRAARRPISPARRLVRAKSRFATLTQAIKRTSATAPMRTSSVARAFRIS